MPMRDIILIHNWWAGDPSAQEIASAYTTRVQSDGGVVEAEDCLISRVQTLKDKGIWNKASAVWLPHGYKEGKLYAAKGGSGADLTHVRAGTRYRKGPTYTEEVPGNLIKNSEDFSSPTWFKTNVDINADLITPTTTLGQHRLYTASLTGFDRYVIRAKAGGFNIISIAFGGGLSGDGIYFNLSTGTYSGSAAGYSAVMTDAGDGWYDCVLILDSGGFLTSVNPYMIIRNGESKLDFSGDGVGGIHVARIAATLGEKDYFKTTDRFNVPALDYTNDTCPAWSIEPSRTNVCLYSDDLSNAAWTKANTTVTANAVTGPDGLTTADKIVEVNNTGFHYVQTTPSGNLNGIYTISVYVKAAERSNLQFVIYDSTFTTAYAMTVVDLVALTATGGGTLTSMGDGWYKLAVTTTSIPNLSCRMQLLLSNGASYNYTGATNSGLYATDFQVELGAYATSYIPTTTATVSRIADSVNALLPKGTNIFLHSQDFNNAYWDLNFGHSITPDAILAPDGTLTADKLNDTAISTNHRVVRSMTGISGNYYTISIHGKSAGQSRYLAISLFGTGTVDEVPIFNLDAGTVDLPSTNTVLKNATITPIGDGWYRCTATVLSNTSVGNPGFYVTNSSNDNTAAALTYVGNGTGFYIWGAQLESGDEATTYVPTTTAPKHNGTVIGQTEGTLYFEGSSFADGTAKDIFDLINGSDTNNRLQLAIGPTNILNAAIITGGVTEANIQYGAITSGSNYKIAVVYNVNYLALFVNGVKIGEDLAFTLPSLTTISVASRSNSSNFYGNGKVWAISKTALTDAQAIALTA